MKKYVLFVLVLIFSCGFAAKYNLPKNGDNVIGKIQTVYATQGDTLDSIAVQYDLGFYELVEANPKINPKAEIPVNTPVILPTQYILPDAPYKGIVINLAELRMYYYPKNHKNVVLTFPLGIGREGWETPQGVTTIVKKQKDPTWFVPESIRAFRAKQGVDLPKVVKPGPDNPLGKFAFRLGWAGYLIHGTNEISSIGRRFSSGCVHMSPQDIKRMYYLAPVGTQVRVVDEPFKIGHLGKKIYLESHVPLQEQKKQLHDNFGKLLQKMLVTQPIKLSPYDKTVAKKVAMQMDGIPQVINVPKPQVQQASNDVWITPMSYEESLHNRS